jgi:hypothetical protein
VKRKSSFSIPYKRGVKRANISDDDDEGKELMKCYVKHRNVYNHIPYSELVKIRYENINGTFNASRPDILLRCINNKDRCLLINEYTQNNNK